MSRIKCDIYEVEIENDRGKLIPGVRAECEECEHAAESFGQGEGSRKRCLVMLREECPREETNFYVEF